jgi:hypothetical protein
VLIGVLACIAAVAFADTSRKVAVYAAVPTAGEARQALIAALERPNRAVVNNFPADFGLAELRAGKGIVLVQDRSSDEQSWAFNCNLIKRTFSFPATKSRGCSFHWVGKFARAGGKWTVQDFHWDEVACSK